MTAREMFPALATCATAYTALTEPGVGYGEPSGTIVALDRNAWQALNLIDQLQAQLDARDHDICDATAHIDIAARNLHHITTQ